MRKKRFELFHLLFLTSGLVMILTSCLGEDMVITPTRVSSLLISPTESNLQRSSTQTASPTSLTPTISETITPTLIPLPTLDYSEEQKKTMDLIQNPGDCRLPCWWGFTPGLSSWQDVRNFMFQMGYGEIQPLYSYVLNEEFMLDYGRIFQTMMMKSHELVWQIKFHSAENNKSALFEPLWHSYSPKKIIEVYGNPSGVYLSISTVNDQEPASTKISEGYSLWYVYNPEGFMIRYDGLAEVQNGKIHICPHLGYGDISWIDFYLQEPVEPLSYGLEFTVDDFSAVQNQTHPLDEATGLSIDQFMGLGQGKFDCFDSPISIWP